MFRVVIWVESFRCAGCLLLQWQGENFAHRKHLKFCHLQLVHCAEKILYLQRYSTAFRNLCLGSKMFRVVIWLESFRCAGCLLLQWQGENFAHRKHLKFCHLQLVHCAEKILYLQRCSTDFRNLCLGSKMFDGGNLGGHLGGKFQVRRCFTFAMGRWKVCASTTFEIFANLNLYTVLAKIIYIQKCSNDFRNLYLSSKMLRVGIWVEGFRCACTLFCNSKGKTLRIDNIWNFPPFNFYTVPAKILYLPRCSTDFRNLCLSSTMLRVGIWVESFSCACILLLEWKGENFAHRQHLRFCHFQLVHCASKNPMSPMVFNRFSKSLPRLEDV